MIKISKEFTFTAPDAGDLVAVGQWELPKFWSDPTGAEVDPWATSVLPAAQRIVDTAAESAHGALLAVAKKLRHDLVFGIKDYPILSLKVWSEAEPDTWLEL